MLPDMNQISLKAIIQPMNDRPISRRKLLVGAGTSVLSAALAGRAHADPFNIDTISNWLKRNGGYDGASRRGDVTGSISPTNAPAEPQPQYQPAPDADEPQQMPGERPPLESPIDYPIEQVSQSSIKPQFRRQLVQYTGREWPGTIVVDTRSRHLYHVREGGMAMRYGIGVGRAGFTWAGEAYVARKARWPRWTPPVEMVSRDPKAAKWALGMPGGPENPLGARALYLFDLSGRDTLYRIHGTNDPSSIGKNLSSGCIRMLNQDIAELHLRVTLKSRVVVLTHNAG
jgi:lipoprotein-anchoring transpeptidase ErfK/SrfK